MIDFATAVKQQGELVTMLESLRAKIDEMLTELCGESTSRPVTEPRRGRKSKAAPANQSAPSVHSEPTKN